MSAAQIKKELIATEAANKCSRYDAGKCQVTPVRGKTAQHQNGFAFKERADEYGQVPVGVY